MSAILSQDDHPLMYLSKKLTSAEDNYSNIEKNALVIVWSTERARQSLLGRKSLLKPDHKTLQLIFNPQKVFPKVMLLHILKWAIKLMAFDFDIEYVKGSIIPHVDTFSLLKFNNEKKRKEQ